jgi:hypothetical protein
MVANIREVLGRAPGTRSIAIVGASHKAYNEAYLHQMRDVTLVNSETALQQAARLLGPDREYQS